MPFAFITPGPGQSEETLKKNSSGNYSSSLYGNTWKIKFDGPQRFKYNKFKTPGLAVMMFFQILMNILKPIKSVNVEED